MLKSKRGLSLLNIKDSCYILECRCVKILNDLQGTPIFFKK